MAGFAALAAKLAALSDVPATVPDAVAEALNDEIREEFVGEKDPYGKAWKPLAKSTVARKGHDRIMYESGDMLAETKAIAVGSRIEFVGTEYGPIHQKAGGKRPARPAVPNQADLPKSWQKAIGDEFAKAVKGALK